MTSSESASARPATSTPPPARFSIARTSAGRTRRSARRCARSSACPSSSANDARCATLGEYTFGSGKQTKDFVLLTLGTGIGGGIVARRRVGAWLPLGGRRDRSPSDTSERRLRLRLRQDRLFRSASLGNGTDSSRLCGRALVSAQPPARRLARKAQLEEDPPSGAGRRRSRPGGLEAISSETSRSAWQTSLRS